MEVPASEDVKYKNKLRPLGRGRAAAGLISQNMEVPASEDVKYKNKLHPLGRGRTAAPPISQNMEVLASDDVKHKNKLRPLGRGRAAKGPISQKDEMTPSPGVASESTKISRGFGRGKPVGLPERYLPSTAKTMLNTEQRFEGSDGDNELNNKAESDLMNKFHYTRVIHPPPIEAFKRDQFSISGWDDFNWLYIRPRKLLSERKVDVSDEIMEWVSQNDENGWLNEPIDIQVGRVILVINKNVKPPKYYRGFVKRLNVSEKVIAVEDLDSGLTHLTNVSNIREVNDKIMEVPVLGHKVVLSNVDFSKHLILPYQFNLLMKKTKGLVFILDDVTQEGKVVLREISSKRTLAEEITGLEKWPWEKFLEMVGNRAVTDSEINTLYEDDKYPEDTIQHLYFPQEEDIDVRVKSFSMESEDKRMITPVLVVEPIHPVTDELRKVMDTQVERYMARVQPSNFYPKKEQLFFLRPPTGTELSGKWHRCVRITLKVGFYYCIDEDKRIIDLKEEYETRSLPVDFRVIPRLTVDTEIKGVQWDFTTTLGNSLDTAFRKFFIVGNIIKVRFSPEMGEYSPIIWCSQFEEIMQKVKDEDKIKYGTR